MIRDFRKQRVFARGSIECVVALLLAMVSRVTAEEHRLVFFGPLAPIFLKITIDTRNDGVAEMRTQYSLFIMERLDADKDGIIKRAEIDAHIQKQPADMAAVELVQKWDESDKDTSGGLTGDELLAAIDQRMGPRFQIMAKAPRLAQNVDLISKLDKNADGRLTGEEIEGGLSTLRSSDFDDDESLSVAELQPYPISMRQAVAAQERSEPARLPIMSLDAPADVVTRILSAYESKDAQGEVDLNSLGGLRSQAGKFDQDKNRRLTATELRPYVESQPADVEMTILIPRRGAKLTVNDLASGHAHLKQLPATTGVSQTFSLGGVETTISAANNRSQGEDNVSLFKTTNFRNADADKNGYLSEAEFPRLGMRDASFQNVDVNADGMLFPNEIGTMVQLSSRLAQGKIVLTISDEAKTVFELVDSNLDRRLTPREFIKGKQQLLAFDPSSNGLAARDLVSRYRLSFSFGKPDGFELQPLNNQMASGQPIVRPQTTGPTWFQRMDRNQDGDLTWREFLGPRDDFDRIDLDQSGLIDLAEATQVPVGSAEPVQ